MFGDGGVSEEFEPSHTYAENGCYTVTLIAYTDCATDSVVVVDAVCVSDEQIVVPTTEWINIYCDAPTINGAPLVEGDVIAAYDPSGALCGMTEVLADGSFGFMPIYRDDPFTTYDEGCEPGDVITIKVNDQVVETPSFGALLWTANGESFMLCEFTYSTETCLQFHLNEGWNLISWNVQYVDDIENLIAPFRSSVDVILGFDQGAQTFDPDLVKFSTLSNVDYFNGYWFKMNQAVDFEICGLDAQPGEVIQIYSGWNLVSYWGEDGAMVEAGFASIFDNLQVVLGYDNGGLVWTKDDPGFNTLDMLYRQNGYWVRSAADDILDYFGAAPNAKVTHASKATSTVAASQRWMSVYGESLSIDGRPVVPGALIEVRTTNGVTVGDATYDGSVLKFTPVYGRVDGDALSIEYPSAGDQLQLFVDGQAVYPQISFGEHGSRVAVSNLSLSKGTDPTLPGGFVLNQNYPNPFNPSTSISYSLPQSATVELAIFNVLGQKIRTLTVGVQSAGDHTVEWDGTDESGLTVSSGVYFYQLEAGGFRQTKKMMLMK
jgi:PKD repeat protein